MKAALAPGAASLMFRQLAFAAHADLPLADVLNALISDPDFFGDAHPPVVLLADAMTVNARLSAGLRSAPELFSAELVALVADAEDRACLPAVLDALARDFALVAEGSAAVRAATIWPRYLGGFYLVLLVVLLNTAVPQLSEAYSAFGADLPLLTRVLVGLSGVVTRYGWLIAAAGIGVYLLRNRLPSGARGALLGAILPGYSAYRVGRFATRLAVWLAACQGEPGLLRAAVRHLAVDARFAALEACAASLDARLSSGLRMPETLDNLPPLPRYLSVFARLADRLPDPSPAMDQLIQLSTDYSAVALDRFARRLTLTSYLVIGVALGGTIIALYLPIFKLASAI
jgi:type II secretory pathway component PulF